MLKLELDLDDEEKGILLDVLDEALGHANSTLEYMIDDETPETIEEFTAVVGTQQQRIGLLQRITQHLKADF